ncbi:MAG TPA: hypothetical protein VFP11_04995, partial [Candidatus Angelobacter sp.]|nr:hypothetical protein [Candidatus Angelobacter sp.]
RLRQLNQRLERFMEQMQQAARLSSSDALTELLMGVVEAGEWIKEPPAAMTNGEADAARRTYRMLLERVRGVLPVLEVRLRMERAQLEAERFQVASASQWSTTARTTLPRR